MPFIPLWTTKYSFYSLFITIVIVIIIIIIIITSDVLQHSGKRAIVHQYNKVNNTFQFKW